MKKSISIVVMFMGIILFCVGLFLKVPSKELTTLEGLNKEYSVIEEYVGGDAYNYIIGASIVSGEINAAKTQKAIFISFGVLIFAMGLLIFSALNDNKDYESKQYNNDTVSNIEENLPEI